MTVGLTGNIGSGKSTVARLFELLGAAVFNSDDVAKQVYFIPAVRQNVIHLLGPEAYNKDQSINKPFISQKIFGDTQLLNALNGIIHPAVIEEFKKFKHLHPGKLLVKESALLFEAHLQKEVDRIVLVTADDSIRMNRVMLRDKLDMDLVKKKMRSQMSQEEKRKQAHYVIRNNGDELLIPQVLHIYNQLMKP